MANDWLWTGVSFLLVSALWGSTNPLLKLGSKGIERVKGRNSLHQILLDGKFLVTRCSYAIPFLLNQTGSLLYYWVVARTSLSLAVPVVNSLTLLFTVLMGVALGERAGSVRSWCGMGLIVAGAALCLTPSAPSQT